MSDPLAVAVKVAKALSMDNRKSILRQIFVSSSRIAASLAQLLSPISSKDVDTVTMRIGGRSSLLMRRFLVTCLMFASIKDV